jgi:ribosomal protein S9
VVTDAEGEEHIYEIPFNVHLVVHDGDRVEAGDQLCEGSVNPHDILRIKGETALQNYLVQEVQKVYRSQGVDINDKHIEVIVRSMLRKKKVTDPGDTTLLPGQMLDNEKFVDVNTKVAADGRKQAQADTVLLGVTKASLATESFLSAASFQETTRVLTQAAIEGKYDPLLGLKENVIIGKLIPAGTGMPKYRGVEVWGKGQPRYREVDIFGEPELPAEIDGEAEPENKFALVAELASGAPLAVAPPDLVEPLEPVADGDGSLVGEASLSGDVSHDGDGVLAVEAPPEAPPETPPVTELDM